MNATIPRVRLVPVVVSCLKCARFYHPCVRFDDGEEPVIGSLPTTCACGDALQTPEHRADILATARHLIETARTFGRGA